MSWITTDDLFRELVMVTSTADARALVSRASRVAGVKRGSPLETQELLMVLEALAAEGGTVQQIAEAISRRALYS